MLIKILKNIHPDSKWSCKQTWKKRIDSHAVRSLLKKISGNQIVEMLNDVLTTFEKNLISSRLKDALKGMSTVVNKIKPKEKHNFILPLKRAKLTRTETKLLGYDVSTYMWKNCENEFTRDNGGRKPIDKDLVFEIEKHMKSLSSVASNRFLKKCQSNAYYSSVSIKEAYSSFKLKKKLCFSSFRKYVSEKFKKAFRFTDLCEYCELNKNLKKEIHKASRRYGFEGPNDIKEIKTFFSDIQFQGENFAKYLQMINQIETINFHYEIAQRQREEYNRNKKNLPKDTLLIELDWKQKIIIGMSPRQVSYEYRNQQQRSFIGFGVYFTKDNLIHSYNIDLISSDMSQKGKDVVQAFRFVRQTELFKNVDCKNYIVWTDAGTHFRCAEFLHYLFNELASEGIRVTYNIFGEKHGKNSRDQHFSVVSNFIQQESHVKKLCSSQDIVDAIHKHQSFTNSIRTKKIVTMAFVFDKLEEYVCMIRHVDNIKNYYNFFSDQSFILMSRVISDAINYFPIKYKDQIKEVDSKNEKQIERKIEIEEISINNLKKKNFLIKFNQRIKKRYIDLHYENYLVNWKENCSNFCNSKCKECLCETKFEIKDLEEDFENLTLNMLIDELKKHGHAKYKKIQGRNRNISQARDELKYHLLKFHSNTHL